MDSKVTYKELLRLYIIVKHDIDIGRYIELHTGKRVWQFTWVRTYESPYNDERAFYSKLVNEARSRGL